MTRFAAQDPARKPGAMALGRQRHEIRRRGRWQDVQVHREPSAVRCAREAGELKFETSVEGAAMDAAARNPAHGKLATGTKSFPARATPTGSTLPPRPRPTRRGQRMIALGASAAGELPSKVGQDNPQHRTVPGPPIDNAGLAAGTLSDYDGVNLGTHGIELREGCPHHCLPAWRNHSPSAAASCGYSLRPRISSSSRRFP